MSCTETVLIPFQCVCSRHIRGGGSTAEDSCSEFNQQSFPSPSYLAKLSSSLHRCIEPSSSRAPSFYRHGSTMQGWIVLSFNSSISLKVCYSHTPQSISRHPIHSLELGRDGIVCLWQGLRMACLWIWLSLRLTWECHPMNVSYLSRWLLDHDAEGLWHRAQDPCMCCNARLYSVFKSVGYHYPIQDLNFCQRQKMMTSLLVVSKP